MSRADRAELKALRNRVDEQNKKFSALQKEAERRREDEIEAQMQSFTLTKTDEDTVRWMFKMGEDKRAIETGRRLSEPSREFAPDRKDPKVIADPDKATFRDLSDGDQKVARNIQRASRTKVSDDEAARMVARTNAKRAARAGAN